MADWNSLVSLIARKSVEAKAKFASEATKIGPCQDACRETLFLNSTNMSLAHNFFQHGEPDGEVDFRSRLLNQNQEEYNEMMASLATYQPSCTACRLDK